MTELEESLLDAEDRTQDADVDTESDTDSTKMISYIEKYNWTKTLRFLHLV